LAALTAACLQKHLASRQEKRAVITIILTTLVHITITDTDTTNSSMTTLVRHMQGAQDAKKAKVWGILAKKIVQAAKAGGADPAGNAKLAEVLKAAKAAEVPKDVVDRNLKKATDKAQADFQEVRQRTGA
jgi:transcriptional/translational regulatory protein YebC/TACO1